MIPFCMPIEAFRTMVVGILTMQPLTQALEEILLDAIHAILATDSSFGSRAFSHHQSRIHWVLGIHFSGKPHVCPRTYVDTGQCYIGLSYWRISN